MQRLGGGKADLLLHYNHSWEAGKDKLVLVRFIADANIGKRQSRVAPPSQRKVSAGKIHCRSKDWEEAKQICSSVTKKS